MVSLSVIQKKLSRLVALGLLAVSVVAPGMAAAATSQPRDCGSNPILYCGAYSKTELLNKVDHGDTKNSAANIQHIYYDEGRGITEANFRSGQTVDGTVYKDGRVVVNGKTVATGAQSIGRTFMPGSVKSGTVWMRPTSTSFAADSIQGWVNMDNGKFHYFILKSCGNAGTATPVASPTPTPKPTPAPSVTPKPSVSPSPSITPTPTPAPEQSFKCVELKVGQPDKANKPNSFRFILTAEVTNVDTTGYRFSIHQRGTSTATDVRDTDAATNFADYTLGTGTWDVHGQLKTTAGITAISDACSAEVTVTAATPAPSPAPTGQVLGATLPATGPETALGGVAGLTAIGYASRAYMRSRKSLLQAMRSNRTTKQ